MKMSISPIVTGLAAAAVVSTATYMLTSHSKSMHHVNAKSIKKTAGKALKTVGGLMEAM